MNLERRSKRRLLLGHPLSASLGANPVWVVDLSETGARLRHQRTVSTLRNQRLVLRWEDEAFVATATILSSRLVATREGIAYVSRVRFAQMDPDTRGRLERIVAAIRDLDRQQATRRA